MYKVPSLANIPHGIYELLGGGEISWLSCQLMEGLFDVSTVANKFKLAFEKDENLQNPTLGLSRSAPSDSP